MTPSSKPRSSLSPKLPIIIGVLVVVVLVAVWMLSRRPDGEVERMARYAALTATYVDDRSCWECHTQQYNDWLGSHHDQAMQIADEETVLGDFDDVTFTHFDVTSRFYKKDGKLFVQTDGPGGELADFEIKYTFGVEPLQQYLVELPNGHVQALTIAWDTVQRRWFHLYADEEISHEDTLHWTGRSRNWNAMCAECHSTNLQKNYDIATDSYDTQRDEINVGCQACHGPGSAHDEWTRAESKNQRFTLLAVNYSDDDPKAEVDACAPCHSRRRRVSTEDRAGRPLMDDFQVSTLRDGLYHADGQILGEVYEYGSFVQSKMYLRGVRCTDCHNPHTLKLVAPGNAVCVQCHSAEPDPRFATLQPKDYDTPDHHFHPVGAKGTQCVDCHMPQETYMVVDPRHDHSFRVPRPDLSVSLGVPNACSACHADRSAQWADSVVADWYGPGRQQAKHYGEAIAAGRAGGRDALRGLTDLVNDSEQPAIVRATALELLQPFGNAAFRPVIIATRDTDPMVRTAAAGSLDWLPPATRLSSLAPLLNDPIRAVRIEAARVLSTVPPDYFELAQRLAFEAALLEYKEAQLADGELPWAHMNVAVIQTAEGQYGFAEESYLTAIRLDPSFLPARVKLANLYSEMERNDEAERMFMEAIDHAVPEDQGELYYSLGLLLREEERVEEAATYLGQAADLLSNRPGVRYDYALALQQLGRRTEAEAEMLKAYAADPADSSILRGLAVFYSQQEDWERALLYARKLVELLPDEPGPKQMLQRIEDRLRGSESD
jgi:predicted CXXCH cytochrome family protein